MEQTMTQMNVRLSGDLKNAGDVGLSRASISPSQAIRALWTFCRDHSSEPSVIESTIRALEGESSASPDEHKEQVLEESKRLMSQTAKLMETKQGEKPPQLSDRELLEEALLQRYEDRGLL